MKIKENATVRLFDRWKALQGLESDAAAAAKLGVTRGRVSHWRRRGSHAEADLIVRMCNDLGEDLSACLMEIANEKRSSGGSAGPFPESTVRHH